MIALNRQAIAFAKGAVQEYGIDSTFFDPAGKVNGAASETADALNRSYADHLTSLGEPNERLDAQGMYALTGSRHYVSGLYTPGTVMLQPAGFVRGFGEGLRASGVTGIAAAELAMGMKSDTTRHFAAETQPLRCCPRP